MLANDWIAGAFALIGVIVGGLIASIASIYLVRHREKRDAQAARQIFESELTDAAEVISTALFYRKWPPGRTRTAWSRSWSMYRQALAADMDRPEFIRVASAYSSMGLLETGLAAGERRLSGTDEEFLRDVSVRIPPAMSALLGDTEDDDSLTR
jgi:hypothetical protein